MSDYLRHVISVAMLALTVNLRQGLCSTGQRSLLGFVSGIAFPIHKGAFDSSSFSLGREALISNGLLGGLERRFENNSCSNVG